MMILVVMELLKRMRGGGEIGVVVEKMVVVKVNLRKMMKKKKVELVVALRRKKMEIEVMLVEMEERGVWPPELGSPRRRRGGRRRRRWWPVGCWPLMEKRRRKKNEEKRRRKERERKEKEKGKRGVMMRDVIDERGGCGDGMWPTWRGVG